jgi:hypothetical protein
MPRPVRVINSNKQNDEDIDIGVTLEFIAETPEGLSFRISNNSGYDIRYGDGYDLIGKHSGIQGHADEEFYVLKTGKSKILYADIHELAFDEYRYRMDIVVDPNNKENSKEHRLVSIFVDPNNKENPRR